MKQVTRYLIFLCMTFVYSHAAKADVYVVVNDSVELENISPVMLSRIYAMQIKTWADGNPIKVYTFSSQTKIYKEFVLDKVKVQPHQLDRHWKRLLFTGMGRTPQVVKNESEMLKQIQNTPGAIGYVSEEPTMEGLKAIGVKVQ